MNSTTCLTDTELTAQQTEIRAELILLGWRVRDWLYLGPIRDEAARAQAVELANDAEDFYGSLLA